MCNLKHSWHHLSYTKKGLVVGLFLSLLFLLLSQVSQLSFPLLGYHPLITLLIYVVLGAVVGKLLEQILIYQQRIRKKK
ncbi:TPA: hypothetical protein HA249_00560 [Candidatus Woesearchaeota archaeon]|nr:hypothetical protein [Candidatus Woesearchaeota archaeon]HII88968.1 hypothetical protein [Candidatus Woesearchaeota archaeon]